MKSKTAKTILISTIISLAIVVAIAAVLLFVLIPRGIVTQEWLYHFFISAIPAFAAALLLAIALLWIENSVYASKIKLLNEDNDTIEAGSYDSSLQDMPFENDYSNVFESSSAIPNDWEYVEEFDSLPEKEQNKIKDNAPEVEPYEPIPEIKGEKTLPPFGEFDFDIPSAPMKFKDLSAATGCINFAWNKDTMERPLPEAYIAPTEEQIARGEFVVHLAPTKADDYSINPSDAFQSLSDKFPKVLHEFDEFVFDLPTIPVKKDLSAATGCVDFEWHADTMNRPEGEAYIAPTEEQIARGEFVIHLAPTKKQFSKAEKIVDFNWHKDSMKRPLGEVYIAPTEEQIAKGEFVLHLAPTKATAKLEEEKPNQTDTSFESLATLEDTLNAKYDISPEDVEEENDAYVISYEKDSEANIAYPSINLPEDVKGGFEDEVSLEEQANEVGEYTGDLYKASSLPTDNVDTNDAYDYLSIPYGNPDDRESFANVSYPRLSLPEDVKGGFEDEIVLKEQANEVGEYTGDLFSPVSLPEDDIETNDAFDYLCVPYMANGGERDSEANLSYPFINLPEDVKGGFEDEISLEEQTNEIGEYTGDLYKISSLPTDNVNTNDAYDFLCVPYGGEKPEKKSSLTAATASVDFIWNKDTMNRPEGEVYIAPTAEQIARGETFPLSPVKGITTLAKKAPSDVVPADTNKGLQILNALSNAYEKLSLPENVEEGSDDEDVTRDTSTSGIEKSVYVPNGKVKENALHSDAYNALMVPQGNKGAESFSEEFRSILDIEMESARLLNYELTIARITSDKADAIMSLDFEALAFKESDNRICMIFQCQNKQEATELLNMIKDVTGDKSMRIRLSELRGRSIDAEAFAKEVLR